MIITKTVYIKGHDIHEARENAETFKINFKEETGIKLLPQSIIDFSEVGTNDKDYKDNKGCYRMTFNYVETEENDTDPVINQDVEKLVANAMRKAAKEYAIENEKSIDKLQRIADGITKDVAEFKKLQNEFKKMQPPASKKAAVKKPANK